QKVEHRVVVRCTRYAGAHQETLDLGGEREERSRHSGVVERLDAQPIAGAEQTALRPVPDGKGEHPIEVSEAVPTPTSVGLKENLRVGSSGEDVAQALELCSELPVVIDLTVEDDPLRRVARRHRLEAPIRKIENGETAVAQADRDRLTVIPPRGMRQKSVLEPAGAHPTKQESLAIGSPVGLEVIHPLQ